MILIINRISSMQKLLQTIIDKNVQSKYINHNLSLKLSYFKTNYLKITSIKFRFSNEINK